MRKNEKNRLLKAQIQEELNAEADNLLDEVDVERIENLVKKLNTYDKVKPDLSDYDRFLYEFNSKNGVKLQSSSKDKKLMLCNNRRTAFKISSKLASAAVIVFAFFISNTAVKADASDSISSWLSEVKNNVVFAFSDESYKEHTYSLEHYGVDYCIDYDAFKDMEITTTEVDFDEFDWSDTLKPNYIPEGFSVENIDIINYSHSYNKLSISFNGTKDKYIRIYINQWDVNEDFIYEARSFGTAYNQTLELDNFKAYIFTGEKKSEAFFWIDEKIYTIRTTLSKEILQKILENMSYGNS